MAGLSGGYAVTVRVDAPRTAGATTDLSSLVAGAARPVTALDVADPRHRPRRTHPRAAGGRSRPPGDVAS